MTPPFSATLRSVRADHGRGNWLLGGLALLLAGLWAWWFLRAQVEVSLSAEDAWLARATPPVSVSLPAAAKLVAWQVRLGDTVPAGALLARLESAHLENAELRAPVAGQIVELAPELTPGAVLSAGQRLALLQPDAASASEQNSAAWTVQARFAPGQAAGRLVPGQAAVLVLNDGLGRPVELPLRLRAATSGWNQEGPLRAELELDLTQPTAAAMASVRPGLHGRLRVQIERTTPALWLWQRLLGGAAQ